MMRRPCLRQSLIKSAVHGLPACLTLLLAFGGPVHAADVAAVSPPNIVFFIADDMQRYMFNCLDEGDPPY